MDCFSYKPGCDYEPLLCLTDEFDYPLADASIAQTPCLPRDACRLLVLDRASGDLLHVRFRALIDELDPGDVLVVNETRVIPARLTMRRVPTGGVVELLLLERVEASVPNREQWRCLVKPARRAKPGQRLEALDEDTVATLSATVVASEDAGIRLIDLEASSDTVHEAVHALGTAPLPPYITETLEDEELYQTVYAFDEHSAAAPTAGLHFTKELMAAIEAKGVGIVRIRLDVGLDTFRPVGAEHVCDHSIHSEFVEVGAEAAAAITAAKRSGSRVIAVGTTTARALESAWQATRIATESLPGAPAASPSIDPARFLLEPFRGRSGLFIVPGYEFGVVDALVTNFHVPRSTLMMMVSAFSSRKHLLNAYAVAQEKGYRFLSFGDAMLIQ